MEHSRIVQREDVLPPHMVRINTYLTTRQMTFVNTIKSNHQIIFMMQYVLLVQMERGQMKVKSTVLIHPEIHTSI